MRDASKVAAPSALSSIAAVRHASNTTTPPSATAAAAPATSPPSESSYPNLDTIVLDDLQSAAATAGEDHIGYLHELGINYGYGVTTSIQWLLEHLHIWGGLPWWASIAATAITLRVAMFPLFVKSSDTTARTTALTPITKPLTDKMSTAQKAGDSEGMRDAWMKLRAVRANAGIRMRDQFAPMIAQGIVGFCGFRLMRACGELPVPSFTTGGFLHLQDLTVPDPFLIVPVLMGATMHIVMRLGGESGAMAQTEQSENMRRLMLWIMPGAITLITGWQSGAVAVWFMSSGAGGLVQARLLQSESVRKHLGIAPLYKPSKNDPVDEGLAGVFADDTQPSYGRGGGRVIDVKGTSKTGPMKPTYQAPNLRNNSTTARSGPRETVAPTEGSEAKKPSSNRNPIDQLTNWFNKTGSEAKARAAMKTARDAEEKAKKKRMQRAKDYEERASGRK